MNVPLDTKEAIRLVVDRRRGELQAASDGVLKSNGVWQAFAIAEVEGKLTEEKLTELALRQDVPQEWKHLLEEIIKEVREKIPKELSLDELADILGRTIKQDRANKLITFFGMLSAFTEDSQFNISYRAPSSTGKSYIPIELASFFPEEDVTKVSYSSPTAFFHDYGEWNPQTRNLLQNWERKILIFLDQPHDQLLQRLRPLLSHDQRELLVKITDKREKGGMRTKNVILRGFPTVIFCTGSLKLDEQEATRNILLSPETGQEKIREALFLKALKEGDKTAYQRFLAEDPRRELLRQRVTAIRDAHIQHIVVPNQQKVLDEFLKRHSRLKPRHTRDMERLFSLIKASALLNLWHRERGEGGSVIANENDIENAFKLWDDVAESQELGIPPYIHRLYKEVMVPLSTERNRELDSGGRIGLSRSEIAAKHYEVYGRPIPDWYLRREILPALESCGLIVQESDPNDKRKLLVYITPPLTSLYAQNNREAQSGIDKEIEMKGGVQALPIEERVQGPCSFCGESPILLTHSIKGNYACYKCANGEEKVRTTVSQNMTLNL